MLVVRSRDASADNTWGLLVWWQLRAFSARFHGSTLCPSCTCNFLGSFAGVFVVATPVLVVGTGAQWCSCGLCFPASVRRTFVGRASSV
jgi:hypothetical protein